MEIEIRIHRPFTLLLVTGGTVWALLWLMSPPGSADAQSPVGGQGTPAQVTADAETQIRMLREEQNVLQKREQIFRAQLAALEEERAAVGDDPALARDIADTTADLVALLQDRSASEAKLLRSLRELWEAQGNARAGSHAGGIAPTSLAWPVRPLLGISARFHDGSYKARFGMEHNAVDIPVEQGSVVRAAADGVVRTASDKGMGFNSLVIEHAGGVSTLYGHVTSFLVTEGQKVRVGDPVALSGGRPGTPGAGMFTTGPHLHFEVHRDGAAIDPMDYLQAEELP